MDCSPPGSSVHGIFQARILEWVAIFPGNLPDPGIEPRSSALRADALTSEPQWKPMENTSLHSASIGLPVLGISYKWSHAIDGLAEQLPPRSTTSGLLQDQYTTPYGRVQLFATPWAIQSMEFSGPEYWNGKTSFSRGSSQPRDQAQVSCIASRFFTS